MPVVRCYKCEKITGYDRTRKSSYCKNSLCSVDLLVLVSNGKTKAPSSFTSSYQCEQCKTLLTVTQTDDDFSKTIIGYCGHEMKAAA